MAKTKLEIRTNISKVKKNLRNKSLPPSIKKKLEDSLKKLEDELNELKAQKPQRKSRAKTPLEKLSSLVKRKRYSTYEKPVNRAGKKTNIVVDAKLPSLRVGKRVSKGLKGNQYVSKDQAKGHTYYEYRSNRHDVKQPPKKYPKLEYGGYMAKGGDIWEGSIRRIDGVDYLFSEAVQDSNGNYSGWAAYKVVYDTHDGEKHINYQRTKQPYNYKYFRNYNVGQDVGGEYFADGGYMAKGGDVGNIYGKMYIDTYKEKQFNKKIEKKSQLDKYAKENNVSIDSNNIIYVNGEKYGYINKINQKTGQEKSNWDINKFADGGYMEKGGDLKKGDYVMVDNPHWKASMGIEKAVKRKVSMIVDDTIFFSDGSNSQMKYVKKMADGGYMAKGGEYDYSKFDDEKKHLDESDYAKINEKVERRDKEKFDKLGTHKKFTDWWYNGGEKIAKKKYGNDDQIAWAEAYQDFKDMTINGGSMEDGGMMKSNDLVVINLGGDRYDGGLAYQIQNNGVVIQSGLLDGEQKIKYLGKEYDGLLNLAKGIGAKLVMASQYKDGGKVKEEPIIRGYVDDEPYEYARGGKLSLEAFRKKYDRNEDKNEHSKNVLLLAQQFGTESDIRDAKTIIAKHQSIGYLPSYLMQERDALSKKLWAKYTEAVKGDGKMSHGGKIGYNEDNSYLLMELDKKSGFGMLFDGVIYDKQGADLMKEKYDDKIDKSRELKILSVREYLNRNAAHESSKKHIKDKFLNFKRLNQEIYELTHSFRDSKMSDGGKLGTIHSKQHRYEK